MSAMTRRLFLTLATLALAAFLTLLDFAIDPSPTPPGELALDFIEKAVLIGVMFAVATLVVRIEDVERATGRLSDDLDHAREEGAAWRAQSRKLMDGLSEAIAAQFEAWNLTPAEADIAGLVLKGLSLKEIAELRHTSEATIRQQAQGIYRKSGLSNRAQLSAYFLEDLYDVAGDGRSVEPTTVN